MNCIICESHSDTPILIKDIDMTKQGKNINWLVSHSSGTKRDRIYLDACCANEILWLLNQGVQTVNCCCGHGMDIPTCIIRNESVELAKQLGYELIDMEFANKDTMSVIKLKLEF